MSTGLVARLGKSRVPSPPMLEHRIQGGEECVYSGGKRHVRSFPRDAQALGAPQCGLGTNFGVDQSVGGRSLADDNPSESLDFSRGQY
jgi:hypothetical protein